MPANTIEPIELTHPQAKQVLLWAPPGLPRGSGRERASIAITRDPEADHNAAEGFAEHCLTTLNYLNGGETPRVLWCCADQRRLSSPTDDGTTAWIDMAADADDTLWNVVLTWENASAASAALHIHASCTDDHLDVQVSADAAELGAGFADMVARYLAHTARAEDGDDPVRFLPPSDRERLLRAFQPDAPDQTDPRPTLHQQFSAIAARFPDHAAVLGDDLRWSYRLLDQQSNFLAYLLRDTLDLQTGDLVAVFPDRRAYLPLLVLATLKAGGVYLPLDPKSPEQRLVFMLDDAAPKVVLCYGPPPKVIQDCDAKVVRLDRLVWHGEHRGGNTPLTGRDLAYTIYTSGSTGHPKAVQVQHDQFDSMIHAQIDGFAVTPQARVLQLASPAFDASLSEIFSALLAGAALVIAEAADVANHHRLAALIDKFSVSHATFPPAYLHELDDSVLAPLQTIISAGEAPIREDLLRLAKHKRTINAYGPTETSVCAAFFQVPADADADQAIPIGRPLPFLRAYIVDPQGRLVPPGVVGELCFAGRGVARGYLHRPEQQAAKFADNPIDAGIWYRTGDLGYHRPDGNMVFVGRRDDQVKINGYRVELGEIKYQMERCEAVDEAVIVVARNAAARVQLLAYYVPNAAVAQNLANHPRALLAQRLLQHMVPHHFVALDQLPRNSSGKVDRKALPHVTRSGQRAYRAPTTDGERLLVGIWQSVLGHANVGADDHFFELGGDSLTAIHVISALPEGLSGLTIAHLFHYPVLAELAAEIDKQGAPLPLPPTTGAVSATERFPLNLHQQDLWMEGPDQLGAVLAVTKPLLKPDGALLEQAATYVAQQHPGLARVFPNRRRAVLCQKQPALNHLTAAAGESAETTVLKHFRADAEPGWAVYLIDERTLVIAASPLLCDEHDMLVLRRDLEQAYRDLAAGRPVQFAQQPESPLSQLEPYAALDAGLSVSRLPATPTERVPFRYEWDRSQTRALMIGAGKPFRCRAIELVAAALAKLADAMPSWTLPRLLWLRDDQRRLVGGPDFSHAVAGHTRLCALPLPTQGESWAQWIRATKENHRRLPNQPTQLSQREPAIHLVWCGRLDTDLPEQNLLGTLEQAPCRHGARLNAARFPLTLRFWVWQGCLHMTGTLDWETIRCDGGTFATQLANTLEDMIDTCCRRKTTWPTPIDFGLHHLDLTTFDDLLAQHSVKVADIADMTTTSAWQTGMLHAEAIAKKPLYLRQHSFKLAGRLEVDAAERAWIGLAKRHAVLRSAFLLPQNEAPLQWTRKLAAPQLSWVDLSHYHAPEQIERAHEAKREQREQAGRDDLFQVMWLRYSGEDHEMVVWLHPLLADTRSFYQLLDEWLISYQAFLNGEPPKLHHRPPFRDYTHWLHGRDHEAARAFWLDYQNKTQPQLLATPCEEPPRPRSFTVTWPQALVTRLTRWCQGHGLALNSALKALWGLSLARQGQRPDPVFGTALSGRPAALGDAQNMLGLFQYLVPWCLHLEREHHFADLVRHTQALTAEMELPTPLPPHEICPNTPMYDHVFLLQPAWQPQSAGALTMTPHYQFEHYPFVLTVFVTVGPELEWRFAYDEHRLREDIVHSLVSSCESMLLRILDTPDASLSALGLVPRAAG